MEQSNFASIFEQGFIPSGKKISGSSRPEIIASSTKDKFVINSRAAALMGLEEGDRVVMSDLSGKPGVESQEQRFYITKGFEYGGKPAGAKLGKAFVFSYSGPYGAIMADDVEVKECNTADLVRMGKGIIKEESGNFVALQKVHMEVVLVGEASPMKDVPPQPIYALTNFEIVEHDPKGISESEEVPEEDVEEEDVEEDVEEEVED
jgi:hypothetical protein